MKTIALSFIRFTGVTTLLTPIVVFLYHRFFPGKEITYLEPYLNKLVPNKNI